MSGLLKKTILGGFHPLPGLGALVLALAGLLGCGGGGSSTPPPPQPLSTLAGIWNDDGEYALVTSGGTPGAFNYRAAYLVDNAQGASKMSQLSGSLSLSGTRVSGPFTLFLPYQALPAPAPDYYNATATATGTADSSGIALDGSATILGQTVSVSGTLTRNPASDLTINPAWLPGTYNANAANTSTGQAISLTVAAGPDGGFTFQDAAGQLTGTLNQIDTGNAFTVAAQFNQVPSTSSQTFTGEAFVIPVQGSQRYTLYFMTDNGDTTLPIGLTAIFR